MIGVDLLVKVILEQRKQEYVREEGSSCSSGGGVEGWESV